MTPTALPSLNPTSPSSLPSCLPTSSPTIGEYGTYVANLNNWVELQNLLDKGNSKTFTASINNVSDVVTLGLSWSAFVTKVLYTPFVLDYYEMVIMTRGMRTYDHQEFHVVSKCAESAISNDIFDLVVMTSVGGTEVTNCGGIISVAGNHSLCWDCGSTWRCSDPASGVVALPEASSCTPRESEVTKFSVVVSFHYREYVYGSVPKIVNMSLTSSSQTITVTASILSTYAGGTLYCRPYRTARYSMASVTGSFIRAGGFSTPIRIARDDIVEINMVLTDLVASRDYTVFCYVTDAFGNGGTQADVLASKRQIQTACCRGIMLTGSPSSVKKGTSAYFAYSIPVFPAITATLTVSAMFYRNGTADTSITAVPLSFTFSANNRHVGLSRRFGIAISANAPLGEYTLVLVLSGSAANLYQAPPPFSFQHLDGEASLDPPSLTSAQFADSGGYVTVCFDKSTDYAKTVLVSTTSTSWSCSIVFSFAGSAHTSCTWTSDRCIRMTFCGSNICAGVPDRAALELLEPGDSVALMENTIRSSCGSTSTSNCGVSYPFASSHSIVVDTSLLPLEPAISLISSTAFTACGNSVIVDASATFGSGGRSWRSTLWEVESIDDNDVSNVVALLNASPITSPIFIPFEYLHASTYTFTLHVTNFFGLTTFSSVDVNVLMTTESASLFVSIDGPSFRDVYSYQEFVASATVSFPECSTVIPVTYVWNVYKNTLLLDNVVSTSMDPRVMKLPPYSLQPGETFYFHVTALTNEGQQGSALLEVPVKVGSTYVTIRGADYLQVPVGASVDLDASGSLLEDLDPALPNSIALSWSCFITNSVSGTTFGDDCSHLIDVEGYDNISSATIVPIKTSDMTVGTEYTFTAAAAAHSDNEVVPASSSVSVAVVPDDSGNIPSVAMMSSFNKFLLSETLRVSGEISGIEIPVIANWSLHDNSGNYLSLIDVITTPPSKMIHAVAAVHRYTLSALPNTFSPGRTYSFRLTAAPVSGPWFETYAEQIVTANGPPFSGAFVVSPPEGQAMTTRFTMNAPFWVDDISDYPISYTFRYSLQSSSAAHLLLGLSSHRSYAQSLLPAGLDNTSGLVYCSLLVTDFFGATQHSATTVIVRHNESSLTNITQLSTRLSTAESSGDSSLIMQTINAASSDLTVFDCSMAPNCHSLNRRSCDKIPHTCSECLDGFIGADGPSNTQCDSDFTISPPSAGEFCSHHKDCTPLLCIDGFCREVNKSCPSVSVEECSGAGQCLFYDKATNMRLSQCLVHNANCVSRCSCRENRYGSACSMSLDEYTNHALSRAALCDSLSYLIGEVDWSPELMLYISGALRLTFKADDVVSSDGLRSCLRVLEALTNISDAGYLTNNDLYTDDGSSSTQQNIMDTISEFLTFIQRSNKSLQDDGDIDTLVNHIVSTLNVMIESLTARISSDMVGGESALEIASSGVHLSVTFSDANDLQDAVLQSPSVGGSDVPAIILPASGLKACDGAGGSGDYVRLSLLEWQQNPLASPSNDTSSTTLMSRIFRFTSIGDNSHALGGSSAANATLSSTYELVLQYTSAQNWTHKAPDCVTYSGNGEESDCPCDVISFDEFEVHFLCFNLLDLCPSATAQRRRALTIDLTADVGVDNPLYSHNVLSRRRRLDFDYEGEADDDGGAHTSRISEYGALVKSLESELVSNLGMPRSFALEEAIPAMSIVFGTLFALICGVIYFSRWDEKDYNYVRYVMNAAAEHRVMRTNGNVNLQAAFMSNMSKVDWMRTEIFGYRYDTHSSNDTAVSTNTSEANQSIPSLQTPSRPHPPPLPDVHAIVSSRADKTVTPDTSSIISYSMPHNDFSNSLMSSISGFFKKRETPEDRWKRHSASWRSSDCHTESDEGGDDDDDGTFSIAQHLDELSTVAPAAPVVSYKHFSEEKPRSHEKGEDSESTSSDDIGEDYKQMATQLSLRSQMYAKNAVASFFDNALPPSSLLESKSGWIRFWQAILREHDWIRCFTYPSLRLPRRIRFLTICTELMIILFVDSLFYGILFEDDGSCENMSGRYGKTEDDCLSLPSRMQSSVSRCVWHEGTNVCELRPPPSTIQFYMVVSIMITLLTVIPNVICTVILTDVCSLRPKFRDLWTTGIAEYNNDPVVKKARTIITRHSELGKLLKSANKSGLYRDILSYIDYTIVSEEAAILMTMAEATVNKSLQQGSLPWRLEYLTHKMDLDRVSHALTFLGLFPDGTPIPLTWMQWLTFGTPRKRIERKLKAVRSRAQDILNDMEMFVEGEEDCKDTLLIQNFILEQLSPFKRYALRHEFFQVDTAIPGFVNGYLWLMAWAFIMMIWMFLMYWVILWALNNSNVTVNAWAYQLIFVLLQEIFINELLQIFIVHVMIIEALRPQLRRIYFALNTVIVSKMDKVASSFDREDVCVVQHMSAACRASRKHPHLPAAQLLMRVDDNDAALCQHNRDISLGWLMSLLIVIPTMLALSHETIQQGIMDILFPTMWCCFLLGNAYLYSVSPMLLAVPYCLVAAYLIHRYCYVIPSRHRKANGADPTKHGADDVRTWMNMNQSLVLSGDRLDRRNKHLRRSAPVHAMHFMSMESIVESSSEDSSDNYSDFSDHVNDSSRDSCAIVLVADEILKLNARRRWTHQITRSSKKKHLRHMPSNFANKYLWHAEESSPRKHPLNPSRKIADSNLLRAETV